MVEDFISSLRQEMEWMKSSAHEFDTIYIGGGTPSCLREDSLQKIFSGVYEVFGNDLQQNTEITMEANPADISSKALTHWKTLGVNRISLGAQSFDDNTLVFLGRRHNRKTALCALDLTVHGGFQHVSCDLLLGLPHTSAKENTPKIIAKARKEQEIAINTGIDHLSLYILTASGSTPLARMVQNGAVFLPKEDLSAHQLLQSSLFLKSHGFHHYEVSNFAREVTAESRHNMKYWTGLPYLGFGPGAHSFDGSGHRWWNIPKIDKYIESISRGDMPPRKEEFLTDNQRRTEKLMLGLRTSRGVSRDLADAGGTYDGLIKELIRQGFLFASDDMLIPTEKGMLTADAIASKLC